MDHYDSPIVTPCRERGQHLKFEDRCGIKVFRKLGYSLRRTAEAVGCSPSTVMYELRRGNGTRKGARGRYPEYSAKRGQRNDEINRSRRHKPRRTNPAAPFIRWMTKQIKVHKWSIDACVGYANISSRGRKFYVQRRSTTSFGTGIFLITSPDLPEALSRNKKKRRCRINKRIFEASKKDPRK